MKQGEIGKITYTKGDATEPEIQVGINIIIHVCNDIGSWGAGFVIPLGNKYPASKEAYRTQDKTLGSGCLVLVDLNLNLYVFNMIGQYGIRKGYTGIPPIRYEAIDSALSRLIEYLKSKNEKNVTFHGPRLGCGLAGGKWPQIERILEKYICSNGFNVIIYDL